MAACNKCGADVRELVPNCPYCGTLTPFGEAQQHEHARYQAAAQFQQQQYAQAQAAQSRYGAQIEIDRLSRQAFTWSLVGLVLCCLPIPSVVGIVLGLRAKRIAREQNLVAPAKSTVGVVLGIAGIFLCIGLYTFGVYANREKQEHRDRLQQEIKKAADEKNISASTACKLADLYFIDNPFQGSVRIMDEVSCDGSQLSQKDNRAELTNVRVRDGSTRGTATICLVRGQRWTVDSIVEGGAKCPDAAPAETASPAKRR